MTPISVNGCPSSVMLRPITALFPPKCPFQSPYDATATFRGSPSPNVRPIIAAIPSKLNNPCSATTVITCSVSPTPWRFLLDFMYEIMPSKNLLLVRHSSKSPYTTLPSKPPLNLSRGCISSNCTSLSG